MHVVWTKNDLYIYSIFLAQCKMAARQKKVTDAKREKIEYTILYCKIYGKLVMN